MITFPAEHLPDLGRRTAEFHHTLRVPTLVDVPLAELARDLPDGWVVGSDAALRFEDPRPAEVISDRAARVAAISSLATSPRSVRLYHLELVPALRAATESLERVVRSVASEGLAAEGPVTAVHLALFLAPPGAVTPCHPDRHHNFLFQLEGHKRVWVEDLDSVDAVEHHRRHVDFAAGAGDRVPELPRAVELLLAPGDAVYVPPTAFHWTHTGDEASIALSVGFSTASTDRAVGVTTFDAWLHRLGIRTRPAGRIKAAAVAPLGHWRADR